MYKSTFYKRTRRPLTREDYLEEERLYREYEIFLHTILRGAMFPKKFLVFSYLYYYRHITAPQLVSLMGKDSLLDTEVVFLRRNEKKGYLTSYMTSETGLAFPLYELTPLGVDVLVSFLKEKYSDDLSDGCLKLMRQRFNAQTPPRSFRHTSAIRDLISSLPHLFDTPAYEVHMEAVFRPSGERIERDELSLGIEESGTFQVDALVSCAHHVYPTWLYFEQDMSTQRKNVLSKKIEKYVTFCGNTGFDSHMLLFGLCVSSSESGVSVKRKTSDQSLYRYLNNLPFLAWQYLSLLEEPNPAATWKNVSLQTIANQYGDFVRTVSSGGRVAANTLDVINSLLDTNAYMTVGEAYQLACDTTRANSQTDLAGLGVSYQNRRDSVRRAACDVTGFRDAALSGMIVGTVPNHSIKENLPLLFPHLFHDIQHSLVRMFAVYGLIPSGEELYSCMPVEQTKGALHLRNEFSFENNRKIYVENIADDAGALVRLFHYLDNLNHSEGVLICIADEDTLVSIKQRYLKSRYLEYSQGAYVLPVKVYFILKDKVSGCIGLSEYTPDGNIRELPFAVGY